MAVFKTQFPVDFPYDPKELLVFALIGVLCGLGGALYCKAHRNYVLWMRSNKQLSKFLQRNRFIYPTIISCLVSLSTFPHWAGTMIASDLPTPAQVVSLFSNFSWYRNISQTSVEQYDTIKHWQDPYFHSIFFTLSVYAVYNFLASILALTLPVPSGVVIPTFKIGAAMGRIIGELMGIMFPLGRRAGQHPVMVIISLGLSFRETLFKFNSHRQKSILTPPPPLTPDFRIKLQKRT